MAVGRRELPVRACVGVCVCVIVCARACERASVRRCIVRACFSDAIARARLPARRMYVCADEECACRPARFDGGHNYTHTVGETVHAALVGGGIDYNCGALYRTNLYRHGRVARTAATRNARDATCNMHPCSMQHAPVQHATCNMQHAPVQHAP